MVPPDIVFIDTSVFMAENYFAPGNRINTLKELAIDKRIRLVFSEITLQELTKHIRSSIRDAWKVFKRDCRSIRNCPEVDTWFRSSSDKKETQRVLDLLEEFLACTHAKVLDYSYCSDTAKVFNDYFEKRKPFGEGMKKDEFPDAFVLISLDKFSKEVHQKIYILSKDNDIIGYESQSLSFVDYQQYVTLKIAEGVGLEEMIEQLHEEKTQLENDIKNEVTDYLNDFRLYQTCLNLTDVSYHTIKNVKVVLNTDDYEVIAVNDRFIEIELRPMVSFQVDVEYVNYDYAMYDREDSEWYGTENEVYEVNGATPVKLAMRYYFAQKTKLQSYLNIEDLDLSALMEAIE